MFFIFFKEISRWAPTRDEIPLLLLLCIIHINKTLFFAVWLYAHTTTIAAAAILMTTMPQTQQLPLLFLKEVAGNGDCLFSCFREALASVGHVYTIAQLRHINAKRALDPNDVKFTKVLQFWCEMRDSLDMNQLDVMESMAVAPVCKIPVSRWGASERQTIYNRLMDRRVYWGDEVAIMSLERELGICVLVWHKDLDLAMRPTFHVAAAAAAAADTKPIKVISDSSNIVFLVLVLTGNSALDTHYELLGVKDNEYSKTKYLFTSTTLPQVVKTTFKQFFTFI